MTSTLTLPRSTTNGLPEPNDGFEWRQAPWGDVLVCCELDRWARHFFTGRQLQLRGGSEHAKADWARVADALGVPAEHLWRMRQVHGCEIFSVTTATAVATGVVGAAAGAASGDSGAELPPQVDSLVTNRPDVGLAVQVADCVPLLLVDPCTGAVAATHAGWRGTAMNVAAATVARLVREYAARPAELIAAIGPSIGPSCFQVGPEVRETFIASANDSVRPAPWFMPDTGDRLRLDIWRANHDQLVAAGLQPASIHIAGLCTMTHAAQFFSYRREQQATGRLLGVIRSRGANGTGATDGPSATAAR